MLHVSMTGECSVNSAICPVMLSDIVLTVIYHFALFVECIR